MNRNLDATNKYEEDDNWEEIEKWECFLCAREEKFSALPNGYLSNCHPLCMQCANEVLLDEAHTQRFRLTYHHNIGDLSIMSTIPVQNGIPKLN